MDNYPENYPERLVELRKVLGLTQQALGKIIGVKAQAIANYEAGIRPPDSLMCLKLALVSPNAEFMEHFCRLAGDPDVWVIVGELVLGKTWSKELPLRYQKSISEWTREDLERRPSWKWAWALLMNGKTLADQEIGAKSMGIPVTTLKKWAQRAALEGPEGFVSEKKKRHIFKALSPRSIEEAQLLNRLLTVLRSPGAKTKGVKAVINEAFENLPSRS